MRAPKPSAHARSLNNSSLSPSKATTSVTVTIAAAGTVPTTPRTANSVRSRPPADIWSAGAQASTGGLSA